VSETRPDPGSLFKKVAGRAASSPGNIVSGAVSLAASAALWNPLPLILWGVGSASYILFSSTSEKKLRQVMDDEKQAVEAKTAQDRDRLRSAVEQMLAEPPLAAWIRDGQLPDYASQYRRLEEIRQSIARQAHDRPEVELATEMGIQRQLAYMLTAYLNFVRARVTYVKILATMRTADPPGAAPPPAPPQAFPGRNPQKVRVHGIPPPPPMPGSQGRIPEFGALMESLEKRIADLRELVKKEPAAAKAREWHIGILEKQRQLLRECGERDQSVSAQLEAFPDAFNVILGRVSASQFDAEEVASTLGEIVQRVEETDRFVKAFTPAMDQMLSGLETAT